ncbi:MAG TPA: hypothetical protein VI300_12840 [Solirubrobacter sp.]
MPDPYRVEVARYGPDLAGPMRRPRRWRRSVLGVMAVAWAFAGSGATASAAGTKITAASSKFGVMGVGPGAQGGLRL